MINSERKIYCQAALFRCSCCNYQAEIYYNEEFLTNSNDDEPCDCCNKAGHYKFSAILIHRDDLDDIVLHGQFASLAEDKNKCIACLNVTHVSWKEIVPLCIQCKEDTMQYVHDVEGKNIQLYAEHCREWAKPSHPNLMFTDSSGSELLFLNGMFSKFSAS